MDTAQTFRFLSVVDFDLSHAAGTGTCSARVTFPIVPRRSAGGNAADGVQRRSCPIKMDPLGQNIWMVGIGVGGFRNNVQTFDGVVRESNGRCLHRNRLLLFFPQRDCRFRRYCHQRANASAGEFAVGCADVGGKQDWT